MRVTIIIAISLSSLLFVVQAGDKKCRALVLEGGGDKGAWQAGALSAMADKMSSEDINYDVISGVSIGSFNGFLVSTFEKGEEKEMGKFLTETWTHTQELFKYWGDHSVETLRGLYDKPSFFDNSPFKDFIGKLVDERAMKKALSIGVTDATTAESKFFVADQLSKDDLKSILLASTSVPALFPYVKYHGSILIDGGVLLNADVRGAILKCKEIVEDEKDIIIDTILCTGAKIDYFDPEKDYNAYQMYNRYKDLENYQSKLSDIFHAYNDYPDIQWRYVVMPLEAIPSSMSIISNSPENIQKMIEMGKDHANKILADPSLTSLDRLEEKKKQEEEKSSKGHLSLRH